MNNLMTGSFAVAGDGPEVHAFLAEAEAAQNEMVALSNELYRRAHGASMSAVAGSSGGSGTMQAALVRLFVSANCLRARLASMDPRLLAPSGLHGLVHGLATVVEALQRQVSPEHRGDGVRRFHAVIDDAVRRYLDAATEEQLERLPAADELDSAAMREALLSALSDEKAAEEEVAEVERGLPEVQQLFLDMVALVDAMAEGMEDVERHVARRRRLRLAGVVAALVLVAVALAVVAALFLARRGGQQQARNLLPAVQLAADLELPAW